MLKSKLEKFVVKRVLILFGILAILDIVFINKRWTVLLGLLLGGLFSVLKFSSYSLVFARIIDSQVGNGQPKNAVIKSLIIFIVNQIVVLPLLFVSFKINMWFFTGVVGGILFVPFVVFINCITEACRITHNNFE